MTEIEPDGEEVRVPPPHEPEVPEMPDSGIPGSSVRNPDIEIVMPGSGKRLLPPVSIAGRAVEIRGEASGLVVEILEEWVSSQYRRVEFLRRDGTTPEVRRVIRGVLERISLVNRVLQAWEGVLSVPGKEEQVDYPDN